MVVYKIETFNTIKCFPYSNCMNILSKISGKYIRDISEKVFENCKKTALFLGD